ncbi:MAG: glycosyltransferase, partial [Cytophagales bacterium]
SKPLILIPSPNVVDDHQRKNANEIFRNEGCLLIEDQDAKDKMLKEAINLLGDRNLKSKMKKALSNLARPDAAKDIVSKIYEEI